MIFGALIRNLVSWLICGMMLIVLPSVKCQTTAVGARSASMAGASVLLEDAWGVNNNPAGLARYRNISMATSLEQRFLMKELGYYGLVTTLPVRSGCFGFCALYSGYSSFIDQKIMTGYGRPFGKRILAGVSLLYVYQHATGESHAVHQVSYEFGTIVLLSDRASLAITSFNPFRFYYKSDEYATLPSIFKLGFSYRYNSSLLILTELEKDLDFPPDLIIALEYNQGEKIFIRAGIRGMPMVYSFGAAFRHKKYMLEFASYYHHYLGFTPQITFQYDLK